MTEEDSDDLVDIDSIESDESSPFEESKTTSDGRKVYNVVTDFAFGPNILVRYWERASKVKDDTVP